MAAVAIPLICAAVSAIGPEIPSIIQTVENLFGHSSQSGQKDGPSKLQAGIDVGTAILTALANAGKIPSAPVVDPSMPAALAGAFQQAVDRMKADGGLGASATNAAPANQAPISTPAPLTSPIIWANGITWSTWKLTPGGSITITA